MMMKQPLLSFSLALLVSLFCFTTTFALSPAAAPVQPASAPPAAAPAALVPTLPQPPTDNSPSTDILGILRNANGFSVFIRLMKTTQLINQINSQLATIKSGGITILAADDGAFSELKAGFLNTLSDRQKLELLQFHVLPDYVSSSNFDTLTNPVRTLASANPSRAQLNVTSFGGSVNISTGVVNTTINGVVYSDKNLCIYKVGKVLLPQDFFATAKTPAVAPRKAPARDPAIASSAKAPAPDKEKEKEKEKPSSSTDSSETSQVVPTKEDSGTMRISEYGMWVSLGVAFVAVLTI